MLKPLLIDLVESAATGLTHATHELGDLATVAPLDKGRSAYDQLHECAFFAELTTAVVTDRAFPAVDWAQMDANKAKYPTVADVLAFLADNSTKLVAAIEAFPDDHWNDPIHLPFGPNGMDKTVAGVVTMHSWNCSYHEGQIVQIGILLG